LKIDFAWEKIAGGCHLNRNIPELITSASFKIANMEKCTYQASLAMQVITAGESLLLIKNICSTAIQY
tara:strand:+ start:326 stop:529 length:204 start_codon:yes stop_codon:yes gene_type:complete